MVAYPGPDLKAWMETNIYIRRGLFNLLHTCKLTRQLGLEAWLKGIEDKYEGKHAPKEVEHMFILRDLIQLLKELLERVKR